MIFQIKQNRLLKKKAFYGMKDGSIKTVVSP